MKKIIIILMGLMLFTGCGLKKEKNIVEDIEKELSSYENYSLTGEMKIVNNEDDYEYNVEVNYKKGDYYKISLINKSNNSEQIILKNESGVYVVTPAINKSFKFQSEWPHNSSQAYILESVLNDIKSDSERQVVTDEENYKLTTKVNYPNNSNLSTQVVTFNNKHELKMVEVLDKSGQTIITFKVTKFNSKEKFENSYFSLENSVNKECCKEEATSKEIDSIIYPMYLPTGTTFGGEETITDENSERVILTYNGEKSFIMIQETSNTNRDMEVTQVSGELVSYGNIVGVMTDTSLNWNNNGVDYYIIGANLSGEELLQIASSTSTVALTK